MSRTDCQDYKKSLHGSRQSDTILAHIEHGVNGPQEHVSDTPVLETIPRHRRSHKTSNASIRASRNRSLVEERRVNGECCATDSEGNSRDGCARNSVHPVPNGLRTRNQSVDLIDVHLVTDDEGASRVEDSLDTSSGRMSVRLYRINLDLPEALEDEERRREHHNNIMNRLLLRCV